MTETSESVAHGQNNRPSGNGEWIRPNDDATPATVRNPAATFNR